MDFFPPFSRGRARATNPLLRVVILFLLLVVVDSRDETDE